MIQCKFNIKNDLEICRNLHTVGVQLILLTHNKKIYFIQ